MRFVEYDGALYALKELPERPARAGVDAAAAARGQGLPVVEAVGHRDRARRRSRRGPDHPPPRVLASLPRALLRRGDPRPAHAPPERARGAARAAAHPRLLLGRLLAVERALPPRRRGALRLPRRRRDRRAARRSCPTGSAPTTSTSRRRTSSASCSTSMPRSACPPISIRTRREKRSCARYDLALARADARGDLRRRRALQGRRAAAPAERPGLRRRGDPAGSRSRGGYRLRLDPHVVEPGHHRHRLLRLTGLDAQENQARRMLNDIARFREATRAEAEAARSPSPSSRPAGAHEVFEPTVAAVPEKLLGGAARGRGLPPGARAPLVPLRARGEGRRHRRGRSRSYVEARAAARRPSAIVLAADQDDERRRRLARSTSTARPTSASTTCPASPSSRTTSTGRPADALPRRGSRRPGAAAARRADVVVPLPQDDPASSRPAARCIAPDYFGFGRSRQADRAAAGTPTTATSRRSRGSRASSTCATSRSSSRTGAARSASASRSSTRSASPGSSC